MNMNLKEDGKGIRFKNRFNMWFKEVIPNKGETIFEPKDIELAEAGNDQPW